MNITCPKCNFSRSVDDGKVPDRPVKVTCPKCQAAFTFEKPAAVEETPQAPAAGPVTCPACGLVQAAGPTCSGCGVNYAMYQKRQAQQAPPPTQTVDKVQENLSELRRQSVELAPENLPKAGFWIRVVAYMLDSALLGLVQFVLSLLIAVIVEQLGFAAEGDPSVNTVIWLFGVTISIGYAVFFTGYCGQTPGKMALRIKVIRTSGNAVSYGRAALREVPGKFLSGILLGIGYLMVAFDRQKQGLHDKIADTYVIKL